MGTLKHEEDPRRDVARERPTPRKSLREDVARRIPGVSDLADLVRRIADIRTGGRPTGLLLLLPVALFLDLFDAADELGGPVGMGLSFVLETAFLLGLTGRPGYAFGFAGIDLIPGVDLVPFATITLLREIRAAWREDTVVYNPHGRVVDVSP